MDEKPFNIRVLHTLGPAGTNCEAAAHHWAKINDLVVDICLHPTLEDACEVAKDDPYAAVLGCVVYPALHEIVFFNLSTLELIDVFLFPTFNMVLAGRCGQPIKVVSSHPAPQSLVPNDFNVRLVNSNSQAALDTAAGLSDACITTVVAAKKNGLDVLQDHGPVPMGFTIHKVRPRLYGAHAAHARCAEDA